MKFDGEDQSRRGGLLLWEEIFSGDVKKPWREFLFLEGMSNSHPLD